MRQPLALMPTSRADLTVTITPSRAQAFARCPLQYSETFGNARPDDTSRHLQVGQYIHELADRHNKAVMAGRTPSIAEVLERVAISVQLRDGSDGDMHLRDLGRESLEAYRAFLEDQRFAAIVASEQYVRTTPRPVAGVPGCAIVLSGRFDLIATRVLASHDEIESNTLTSVTCIDVKTSISADLADQPSSAIYDHLARFAYGADDVELMQVTRTGRWASVRLTPAQIEDGKRFCRQMVAASQARHYAPHPGGYCDYCEIVATCPAHRPRQGWESEF
jgi:hypothetical protein